MHVEGFFNVELSCCDTEFPTRNMNQDMHKERIGLYGGSFDPVHQAHLGIARTALEQASLDRLVFIPAAKSPLKAHGPLASDADRLDMLRLVLEEDEGFAMDDFEIRQGGISYTLNTVKHFREQRPGADFFWIMGGDQLEKLHHWRAIEDLVRMVSFLVMARPGVRLSPPELPGLKWTQLSGLLMDESSSSIRERISRGESVAGLLPASVEAFIQEKGLYT